MMPFATAMALLLGQLDAAPALAPPAPSYPPGAPPPATSAPAPTPAPMPTPADGPRKALTLTEALRWAQSLSPRLGSAEGSVQSARGQLVQDRSALLPQVRGVASWQRTTANFTPRPGIVPPILIGPTTTSWNTFDFFNFELDVSQLVYDFGQAKGRFNATRSTLEATEGDRRATGRQLRLDVQTAYFGALAAVQLVAVADDQVANQIRHFEQTRAFVEVGTRPPIDLATARANLANARKDREHALSQRVNNRASLAQAIGVSSLDDYELLPESVSEVKGELGPTDPLLDESIFARPEVAAAQARMASAEQSLYSAEAGYLPSMGITSTLVDAGTRFPELAYNFNVGATINLPLWNSFLTSGRVQQAQGVLLTAQSNLVATKQGIRLQIEQAQASVREATGVVQYAQEALQAADERLKLAEARYQAGAGDIIELADAQTADTAARVDRVRADYSLAVARAQLLFALGR